MQSLLFLLKKNLDQPILELNPTHNYYRIYEIINTCGLLVAVYTKKAMWFVRGSLYKLELIRNHHFFM